MTQPKYTLQNPPPPPVSPKVPAAPDGAPSDEEPAMASTGPEPEIPPAVPGYTFSNPPPVPMADSPAQPIAPETSKVPVAVPQTATAPAKSNAGFMAGIIAGVVAVLVLAGIAYGGYFYWKSEKGNVNLANAAPALASSDQSPGLSATPTTPAAPEAPAIPPATPQNNSVPQASPVSPAPPVAPAQAPVDQASGPMADAASSSPAPPVPTSDQPSGPITDQHASSTPTAASPSMPPQAQPASSPIDAQPQSAPTSQQPPPAESETQHASTFDPDDVLQSCLVNTSFGAVLEASRFNTNYKGRTMAFEGTVARLNDQENLVIFHGGGVYPRNWDIQLSSNHTSFIRNKTYRVEFRLMSIKTVPFGGFSFRGQVLDRTIE